MFATFQIYPRHKASVGQFKILAKFRGSLREISRHPYTKVMSSFVGWMVYNQKVVGNVTSLSQTVSAHGLDLRSSVAPSSKSSQYHSDAADRKERALMEGTAGAFMPDLQDRHKEVPDNLEILYTPQPTNLIG
ncbi:hypothetical protein GSI_06840 [Ganoderma sinense ZZ0214-1]|uniref:Uncharacterized protein n=1 Tax=Ganoderma sinense ZZ0214-1 TaxID=1077348 RepID=A0A2G8SED8_9APHY|nr:hypothetical protein GSI_06840 [Ganoderma sinense ZZ0214-1]